MIDDRLERRNPFGGLPTRFAVGGNECRSNSRFGQYIVPAHDSLMNIATCRTDSFDRADHQQRVVEFSGAAVLDIQFGYRISALTRIVHHSLVNADARQHVRARSFHEMQVTRMIDDARKIGVFKIDADGE